MKGGTDFSLCKMSKTPAAGLTNLPRILKLTLYPVNGDGDAAAALGGPTALPNCMSAGPYSFHWKWSIIRGTIQIRLPWET